MTRQSWLGPLRVRWDAPFLDATMGGIFGREIERVPGDVGQAEIAIQATQLHAPLPLPERPRDFYLGSMSGWSAADHYLLGDGRSRFHLSQESSHIRMEAFLREQAGEDAEWIDSMPAILMLAARRFELFHLHAALLGVGGESLLIVGDSFAGKSSLTVGLCELGAHWAGDDIALLQRLEPVQLHASTGSARTDGNAPPVRPEPVPVGSARTEADAPPLRPEPVPVHASTGSARTEADAPPVRPEPVPVHASTGSARTEADAPPVRPELVEGQGRSIGAWGTARHFHLRQTTAALFPRVSALGLPPRSDGRVDVDPLDAWPNTRLQVPATPTLVVLPRIVDQPHSRVRPSTPTDAMEALLKSSAMMVLPDAHAAQEQLELVAGIVGQSRHLVLELGRDGLQDPLAPARALVAALAE